jgi:hypothetical protein
VKMFVVHRAARAGQSSRAIAPGVQAVPWQEFVTDVPLVAPTGAFDSP